MAPSTKRWIDKKSAANFQLRFRSQADPLIHDSDASEYVLTQVNDPNAHKRAKSAAELEAELGSNASAVRANEGEASMYGIYYDDSSYDYMQHLRELGVSSDATYIEAPQNKKEGKKKQTLDDALRFDDAASSVASSSLSSVYRDDLIPKELLPSEFQMRRGYQDQQDVPDALAGFQPDMDPRLREVLEALDDEAFVDEDEDIFGELTKDGQELEEEEFEDTYFDEDEEEAGYDSDKTEKAVQPKQQEGEKAEHDWTQEFARFKKDQKKGKKVAREEDMSSMAGSSIMSFGASSIADSLSAAGGRRRRKREKKGTATASSGYSMSSSALVRTEGLTLLDDCFDRIEEEYNEDSDNGGNPPQRQLETRKDFDNIMDEFLNNYNTHGRELNNEKQSRKKLRVLKGKHQSGLDQLDEIRRGLGRAKIR